MSIIAFDCKTANTQELSFSSYYSTLQLYQEEIASNFNMILSYPTNLPVFAQENPVDFWINVDKTFKSTAKPCGLSLYSVFKAENYSNHDLLVKCKDFLSKTIKDKLPLNIWILESNNSHLYYFFMICSDILCDTNASMSKSSFFNKRSLKRVDYLTDKDFVSDLRDSFFKVFDLKAKEVDTSEYDYLISFDLKIISKVSGFVNRLTLAQNG